MTMDDHAVRRLLLNQIAIIAGLKEWMSLSHGNKASERSVERWDDAIKSTVDLLRAK